LKSPEIPTPQTPFELAITSDPEWMDGMLWGKPRPGHPEGSVGRHTIDVLENIEKLTVVPKEREELRVIALFHDACKNQIDQKPGGPHHGHLARQLAERYLEDERLLCVIERHDDAFRIYRMMNRSFPHPSPKAQEMMRELLQELREKNALRLFINFFACDATTGNKSSAPYEWFIQEVALPTLQGDAQ
jgi:hypothetical protein